MTRLNISERELERLQANISSNHSDEPAPAKEKPKREGKPARQRKPRPAAEWREGDAEWQWAVVHGRIHRVRRVDADRHVTYCGVEGSYSLRLWNRPPYPVCEACLEGEDQE